MEDVSKIKFHELFLEDNNKKTVSFHVRQQCNGEIKVKVFLLNKCVRKEQVILSKYHVFQQYISPTAACGAKYSK